MITEFHGRGTHNGVLETPMGKFNPTGKKLDLPYCEIFIIKNGKLVSSTIYLDRNIDEPIGTYAGENRQRFITFFFRLFSHLVSSYNCFTNHLSI